MAGWNINKVNYDFNFLFLHFGKHEQKVDDATLQQSVGKSGWAKESQVDPNLLSRAIRENQPSIIAYDKGAGAWGQFDYFTGSQALEGLKKGDRIDVTDPTGRHIHAKVSFVNQPK